MNVDRNEERRKIERSLCYLDVIEPTTRQLIGHAGDINCEGLNLITKSKIPLSEDLLICVEFPGNDTCVSLVLRSIWSELYQEPFFYKTGCQIIEPSSETIRLLNQLVGSLVKGVKRSFKYTRKVASLQEPDLQTSNSYYLGN
jgi:hypothetical protein